MSFSSDLLEWYDRHRRHLPWRGERDPYRVWLSEIMLQQTQVETVRGYYERFLERFPTVFDLADAPEDEVLKLWEGLGYYARARHLHAAAKRVARDLGGAFPDSAQGLRALPGIGPYASNAIASIAYDECVPALDGNQARVLSRILAWREVIKTPFDLLESALEQMDSERPGDYNQALMDLGASLCLPKNPKCDACPVRAHCLALAEGRPQDYPVKPAAAPKREVCLSIVLLSLGDRLVIHRRPPGLLGGLYEFCAVDGHGDARTVEAQLATAGFVSPHLNARLCDSRHVFTHLIWHMQGWLGKCDGMPEGYTAVTAGQLEALAFPGALRVYRQAAGRLLAKASTQASDNS